MTVDIEVGFGPAPDSLYQQDRQFQFGKYEAEVLSARIQEREKKSPNLIIDMGIGVAEDGSVDHRCPDGSGHVCRPRIGTHQDARAL